jgi:LPXTG-motif cell wall-anchored protein
VPSVCRRIVVLLAVACLGVGVGPVATALAQGAGDQQYQDPFGDSGSDSGNSDNNSSSGSGSSGSSDSGSSDPEPLTPAPQTSGGGSSSGSGTSSPPSSGTAGTSASGTTTTAPAATLPNTGLDTRLLLLGGAVLVLLGAGLRLRNAPERF